MELFKISGATYPGVPHDVVSSWKLSKRLAKPKSAILTTLFASLEDNNTFSSCSQHRHREKPHVQ